MQEEIGKSLMERAAIYSKMSLVVERMNKQRQITSLAELLTSVRDKEEEALIKELDNESEMDYQSLNFRNNLKVLVQIMSKKEDKRL